MRESRGEGGLEIGERRERVVSNRGDQEGVQGKCREGGKRQRREWVVRVKERKRRDGETVRSESRERLHSKRGTGKGQCKSD